MSSVKFQHPKHWECAGKAEGQALAVMDGKPTFSNLHPYTLAMQARLPKAEGQAQAALEGQLTISKHIARP